MRSGLRRWAIVGSVALLVAVVGMVQGCTQADQPKLADAPAIQPEPPKEPPKIPGQKKPFTQVEGYSKYMSKGGQTSR